MSEVTSWEDRFAAIDAVTKDLPLVERACNTCRHAEIPPMPDDSTARWIGICRAPVPVNVLLHPAKVQMTFAAADAVRWHGKRMKSCPVWIAARND